MTMTRVERRWLSVVLSSFIDPTSDGLVLRPGEVDFAGGALAMYAASSSLGRFGLRLAVVTAMISPLLLLGRLKTFAALGASERSALLARICGHRLLPLRGLGMLLKLAASMAMFRVASVRVRTNHDRRPSAAPLRLRVALPLLATPVTEAA